MFESSIGEAGKEDQPEPRVNSQERKLHRLHVPAGFWTKIQLGPVSLVCGAF